MKHLKTCALLCVSLLAAGGCAATTPSGTAQPEEKAAVERVAAKEGEPAVKVKIELDETGRRLLEMANRNVVPKKSNPKVIKVGKEYLATYREVDFSTLSTRMSPGRSKSVPYVGIISYSENSYQCRGTSRAEALSLKNCTSSKTNMQEMISYDGKKWQY